MKTAFVSGVLFASLIPLVAHVQSRAEVATTPPCDNLLVHEPIVLYDLSGSTLAGPVDRTLTIYGDGSMKLAATSVDGPGRYVTSQTTPEVASALQQALVQARASTLCDDPRLVTDVPLHTLTLLDGAQDGRTHTFSYWIGDGNYARVDALLEKFINEQFPGF